MKFFLPDELNDEQWKTSTNKYWNLFNTYKHQLSDDFVSEYEKHGFHDFELVTFKLRKKYNSLDFMIELSDWDKNKYRLTYKNVQKYSIRGTFQKDCIFGVWLYSEIYPVGEALYHEIQFTEDMAIEITFSSIELKRKLH